MIRAVIFDFDGTIADTIDAIQEAVNLTMRKYGFPEHDRQSVCSFISNGVRALVQCSMPEHLQKDEALLDSVVRDYNEIYGQVYLHTDRAYDGIPELIRDLHDRGIKIGVLSNKRHDFVVRLSESVLIKGTVDAAQGVLSGKPTKPDPYLSQLVARALDVPLSECAMVGDSDVDIDTAKNAGMIHVGVSWGYREEAVLREKGAKYVASTPDELGKILQTLI